MEPMITVRARLVRASATRCAGLHTLQLELEATAPGYRSASIIALQYHGSDAGAATRCHRAAAGLQPGQMVTLKADALTVAAGVPHLLGVHMVDAEADYLDHLAGQALARSMPQHVAAALAGAAL